MDKVATPQFKIETRVRRLAPHMGLEVEGLKLAELDEDGLIFVKELMLENKLLVFRDQFISAEDLMAFSDKLGEVQKYPFSSGIEGHPNIVEIRKEPHQQENFSGMWHVDSTYLDSPPDFTILTARATPEVGGDTVFSDSQTAFSRLSSGMKEFLLNNDAVYISNKHQSAKQKTPHLTNFSEIATANASFEAIHPAAKINEDTGNPSIYVNKEHTHKFANMTVEESTPILEYLYEYVARPEFTTRIKWENGTVVMWDNRSVQHHAVNDYYGSLRVMHRVIVNRRTS
ncbi:TauD/TfdA dioxygenase family protein [Vibrio penaeicida]|uniref:Taurine dioxygenase n=1 Tax=Vibrio penaeicida TaxID=104609 RepID=A0AAV5P0D7_9VIBR|nr:TauD/TfdA family dioxygenase [Vibrio penaeicida]GLQ76092.1 taurine dioxygenase [Vibrio penaeicida]